MRAYNNFLSRACSNSGGRLRFAALVPSRDIEESKRELRRAKELGAVSVMLLGVAWDRSLGDEQLAPFYHEAAALNLPVCIHFGWGCPAITEAFYVHDSFNSAVLPVLMGFFSVLTSGVMQAVPRLRFAFLESGSQWIPYVLHQIRRRGNHGKDPADYFREGRAYIACEADEDIDYLIKWTGEDALVVASDYPHSDASHEDKMAEAIMKREDLSLRVKEKILTANPQALYQL